MIGSPFTLHRGNLKTLTPSSSAPLARTSGLPFTSGIVKTPTISCPFNLRFLYTSRPNCDWPIIAIRIEAIVFADVWTPLTATCLTRRQADSILLRMNHRFGAARGEKTQRSPGDVIRCPISASRPKVKNLIVRFWGRVRGVHELNLPVLFWRLSANKPPTGHAQENVRELSSVSTQPSIRPDIERHIGPMPSSEYEDPRLTNKQSDYSTTFITTVTNEDSRNAMHSRFFRGLAHVINLLSSRLSTLQQ